MGKPSIWKMRRNAVTGSSTLNYRPDIDGLRAIAILLVILYHAFPSQCPGGFIGVSVFFVISGYLISSIILRRSVDERFSFLEFYARRARRIIPALAVVLIAVWLGGRYMLGADEFKSLGIHVFNTDFGSLWLGGRLPTGNFAIRKCTLPAAIVHVCEGL